MGACQSTYKDRLEAGKALAGHLLEYAESPDVVVLALARGGVPVAFELAKRLRLPLEVLVVDHQQERTASMYRAGRQQVDLRGKQIILVDDGLTDEWVVRRAIQSLGDNRPLRTIVAVPLASPDKCRFLESEADAIVCPVTTEGPGDGEVCYGDRSEVTDDEVQTFMKSRV
jgi:predicted phosphoribosyltransferase